MFLCFPQEYSKQRTRIGVRQLKEIAATMYFHLPPALPPFIVLASLPRKAVVDSVKDTKTISRRFVPLFSLPFARSLAFGGLALTMLSWADMVRFHQTYLVIFANVPMGHMKKFSNSSAYIRKFIENVD